MTQYKCGNQRAGDGKISERVVTAVADALDVDSLELPPLYDVIDPDALDQLFEHGFSAGKSGPGRVSFTMAGCEVVVHGDGEVDATARGDQSRSSSAADAVGKRDEAESLLD